MALKSAFFLVLFAQLMLVRSLVEPKTHVVKDGSKSDASLREDVATVDKLRPDMQLYEKFLKNFPQDAVKKVLPKMMKMIENVDMSSNCLSSLLKYVASLQKFDASANVPSGIFDGTVNESGEFDQCLKNLVKNERGKEDLRGQYFSVEAIASLGSRLRNLSLSIIPHVKFNDSEMEDLYSFLKEMDPVSLLLFSGAGAAVVVGGATVALPALGFTGAGVAAGSMAAGVQSMIGNVAAGSLFASLQSAGVAGLAGATQATLAATGAAAGAAARKAWLAWIG